MPNETRSLSNEIHHELAGRSGPERAGLARRLKERFEVGALSASKRLAAEQLARTLAADAIETVRQELAEAVKHYRFLPRDIALKIAHDIDSVACPFLQATEVFSEEDWQQLVLTVSPVARVAIARRETLSEPLVDSLAQVGGEEVAEALVANPQAPLTPSATNWRRRPSSG
jgi:uncharacterized protein (DUF2336 family)